VAVVCGCAAALLFGGKIDFSRIVDLFHQVVGWCAGVNPLIYVLALALLPYVGVPTTVLYLVASQAYGQWYAILWSTLGLALNLPVGYWIGTRAFRQPIIRWLEKRGRKLPEVPSGEHAKLVVLTRILQGPPLIVQNLLLAVAGVPFAKYFLISMPIITATASALILAGGALAKGNTRLFVIGACAMVALALLSHVVKTTYDANRARQTAAKSPAAPSGNET